MRLLRRSLHAVLMAGLALPAVGQHAKFDTNPLVGTWERVSLLRNEVSVQPPDAPLYLKIGADGYFSMMEMPDDRQKISKTLEQMTREELVNRSDKVEGGWGHYLVKRDLLNRIHRGDIAPAREGSCRTFASIFSKAKSSTWLGQVRRALRRLACDAFRPSL